METKEPTKKVNVFRLVTDRIIEQLTKGVVPWQQSFAQKGIPINLITGKPYRGVNVMLLNLSDYPTNHFLTVKQLKELGAKTKRGEKAHVAVYWQWPDENLPNDDNPKTPELRYHSIFNIAQCTSIPASMNPPVEREIISCDEVLEPMSSRPFIRYTDDQPYYNPLTDEIFIPDAGQFATDEEYWKVFFRQLVHSSGRWNRLNRKGLLEMIKYTGQPFSYEELVADIGSVLIASYCGLELPYQPNAAYIEGWVFRLQNDSRIIIQAAAAAQKAVDYILNIDKNEYEVIG